ncbi:hypothetical protein HDV00_005113 [Rhizophlyctis rosea]|nr:hypothetical protein HDV00_005113 [Rhizophlyctis rosea]
MADKKAAAEDTTSSYASYGASADAGAAGAGSTAASGGSGYEGYGYYGGYGQSGNGAGGGSYDQSAGYGQYADYGTSGTGSGNGSNYGGDYQQSSYGSGGNQDYGKSQGGGGYQSRDSHGGSRGGGGGGGSYGADSGGGQQSGGKVYSQDTVYVSNLPQSVTEESLTAHFASIGIIKIDKKTNKPKVWVYKDKMTGQPKGDATVTYEDPGACEGAINWFNGQEFEGTKIKVELAEAKAPPPGGWNKVFLMVVEAAVEVEGAADVAVEVEEELPVIGLALNATDAKRLSPAVLAEAAAMREAAEVVTVEVMGVEVEGTGEAEVVATPDPVIGCAAAAITTLPVATPATNAVNPSRLELEVTLAEATVEVDMAAAAAEADMEAARKAMVVVAAVVTATMEAAADTEGAAMVGMGEVVVAMEMIVPDGTHRIRGLMLGVTDGTGRIEFV